MNKQTEALKMALEALQNVYFENEQLSFVDNAESNWKQRQNAIKACKEALEQPAQEPVAWTYENLGRMEREGIDLANELADIHIAGDDSGELNSRIVKLLRTLSMTVFHQGQKICELAVKNTHPTTWQSLSDDDMEKAKFYDESFYNGARWAEQALKERNHGNN